MARALGQTSCRFAALDFVSLLSLQGPVCGGALVALVVRVFPALEPGSALRS
jgi:hypothetical protein